MRVWKGTGSTTEVKESVKEFIEERADALSLSINTWLAHAVRYNAALQPSRAQKGAIFFFELSSEFLAA